MYGSGPFGEASGLPVPVAVENFHALKARQTSEAVLDTTSRQGRVNLLNWDGKGAPTGIFPGRHRKGELMNTERPRPYTAGLFAAAAVPGRDRSSTWSQRSARSSSTLPARLQRRSARSWTTSHSDHLMDVQRHYVETFDMRRKCSPYLTYWTHGDTRNRGMALLHFKEAYREAGVTIDEQELPDHLAVVLEFAACNDAELGNALLAEHRGVIGLLHRGPRRRRVAVRACVGVGAGHDERPHTRGRGAHEAVGPGRTADRERRHGRAGRSHPGAVRRPVL